MALAFARVVRFILAEHCGACGALYLGPHRTIELVLFGLNSYSLAVMETAILANFNIWVHIGGWFDYLASIVSAGTILCGSWVCYTQPHTERIW